MNNLLIVDDERELLDTLADAFVAAGHLVTKAETGVEALNAFKNGNFDAGLFDVELPEKNGFELTREIKDIAPDFPIVLITGYSHLYRPQDVLGLDVEAFLKKPLNIPELISIINRVIANNKSDLENL